MISDETRERIAKARDSFPNRRSAILPALHAVQAEAGYVSEENVNVIGEILDLHPTDVFQVAAFYSLIHFEPKGKLLVEVCVNLPCALRGADKLAAYVQEKLGIEEEEGSTSDHVFHFRPTIECLAGCSSAPMMQVNQRYFENLTEEKVDRILDELRALAGRYPESTVPGPEIGKVAHATERQQQ